LVVAVAAAAGRNCFDCLATTITVEEALGGEILARRTFGIDPATAPHACRLGETDFGCKVVLVQKFREKEWTKVLKTRRGKTVNTTETKEKASPKVARILCNNNACCPRERTCTAGTFI
jgi:hypothetical protein